MKPEGVRLPSPATVRSVMDLLNSDPRGSFLTYVPRYLVWAVVTHRAYHKRSSENRTS